MIEISRKGRTISSLPSFLPCLNDGKRTLAFHWLHLWESDISGGA